MGCVQMPPALEEAETLLVSGLSWGTCFQVMGLCLLPQPQPQSLFQRGNGGGEAEEVTADHLSGLYLPHSLLPLQPPQALQSFRKSLCFLAFVPAGSVNRHLERERAPSSQSWLQCPSSHQPFQIPVVNTYSSLILSTLPGLIVFYLPTSSLVSGLQRTGIVVLTFLNTLYNN